MSAPATRAKGQDLPPELRELLQKARALYEPLERKLPRHDLRETLEALAHTSEKQLRARVRNLHPVTVTHLAAAALEHWREEHPSPEAIVPRRILDPGEWSALRIRTLAQEALERLAPDRGGRTTLNSADAWLMRALVACWQRTRLRTLNPRDRALLSAIEEYGSLPKFARAMFKLAGRPRIPPTSLRALRSAVLRDEG